MIRFKEQATILFLIIFIVVNLWINEDQATVHVLQSIDCRIESTSQKKRLQNRWNCSDVLRFRSVFLCAVFHSFSVAHTTRICLCVSLCAFLGWWWNKRKRDRIMYGNVWKTTTNRYETISNQTIDGRPHLTHRTDTRKHRHELCRNVHVRLKY